MDEPQTQQPSSQPASFVNAQGQPTQYTTDASAAENTPGQATSSDTADVSADDIVGKDLFELMGVENMPEDKKQELYKQAMETIEKRTFARVHDSLPEADLPQFKQLIDTGTPQQLTDFLKQRNIDLEKLMAQEAFIYKTEMVELSKPLRNAAKQSQ